MTGAVLRFPRRRRGPRVKTSGAGELVVGPWRDPLADARAAGSRQVAVTERIAAVWARVLAAGCYRADGAAVVELFEALCNVIAAGDVEDLRRVRVALGLEAGGRGELVALDGGSR